MKWEYLIDITTQPDQEQMTQYGQKEWELVAVSGGILYYKRPADKQVEKQQMAAQKQRLVDHQRQPCSSR